MTVHRCMLRMSPYERSHRGQLAEGVVFACVTCKQHHAKGRQQRLTRHRCVWWQVSQAHVWQMY